ncbi:acetyl/propionyl/methylcrotonyl-CoA carboxylase subunit alpha [Nonomuraea sp. NPDC050663]|uniref:acetyl/propionyl/methylcrotonyl-CoA carboxylase subunit alpha n=1 Tax=Nonomuraea sp. NPDC050663 TaxID=3364370 RepID=UPI0037B4AFDF
MIVFRTVLVANRGEIAIRVMETLDELGIAAVAVYTQGDLAHVAGADRAYQIPKYLDMDAILAAARDSGAQAVHPGYGFLAENAEFARRCADEGIVFIGPPPAAIEAMGDKIRAKATVAAAGVPVVPGAAEPGDDLLTWSEFPALIKPSAGGGGKGMVVVRSAGELPAALESARRTAQAAFGDGTLLIERYIDSPRHIEIQVMADTHGDVVHLGERECSLQRRHQKIIEEAPSPFVTPEMREEMGRAAVEAARSVGYVGAGTIEFIVDGRTGSFHFMEMNTRLQVEHPVTEEVTRLDLVKLQLLAAAGEPLGLTQDSVRLKGHSVEARVYAEDPARGFLPTGGRVLLLREPFEARVDSGIEEGVVVGSSFDPMLSKVIVWDETREGALQALDRALAETTILGLTTNIPFLRALTTHPQVRAGELDTGLVERLLPELTESEGAQEALVAAALYFQAEAVGDGDPWASGDGWRLGEAAWTTWRLESRQGVHRVLVRGSVVTVDGGAELTASARRTGTELVLTVDGRATRFETARDGDTLWLGRKGAAWQVRRHRIGDPGDRPGAGQAADGVVRSPMPGTVLLVKAQPGDEVDAGQALVIVEAMKMEHTVTAPHAGTVKDIPVKAGQSVDMDAVLAVVEP